MFGAKVLQALASKRGRHVYLAGVSFKFFATSDDCVYRPYWKTPATIQVAVNAPLLWDFKTTYVKSLSDSMLNTLVRFTTAAFLDVGCSTFICSSVNSISARVVFLWPSAPCGYLKANTQYDSLFYNNLCTHSSTGMFHAEMDGSQTSLQMRSMWYTDIYGTSFVWDEQASFGMNKPLLCIQCSDQINVFWVPSEFSWP